ncbi:792c6830-6a34-4fce-850e-daaa5295d776-CDS [Sclerotinia trifoliorum]|uniref:792c6830-6a34-4fce-850e-daaa5295d776-CDS n=1 Tax=Sclerotinia trifoliorum TaxID=28548 RepID=A0A8H2ZV25_9HELO|nr:792c6830-6a34-4fce-850e-daaa5295d776-CDS [Sclerotinia trifoliorum]
MSQSLYSSLLLGFDSTRLLRLMPHEDENAEITCRLFVYPLHDSIRGGTHMYEALSYAWGGIDNPRFISVNGQDLIVRENLHAALLRLRDPVLERIIWIDAICINQKDPKERGHQVQLMAKIYSKACRVIIWLGEAADDSDQALEEIVVAARQSNITNSFDEQFMNPPDEEIIEQFIMPSDQQPTSSLGLELAKLAIGELETTSDNGINQMAVLALLQRPWFQRIWVLQEVAAARNILIRCGSVEIDGHAFCLGLASLEIYYKADPGLQSLVRSVTYLMRESIFRPKCATSSSNNYSLNIRPLVGLIEMYYAHQASDDLDRVYALLAMSSDNPVSKGLLPDYTISWAQLFLQLVKFILCEKISVDICQTRRMAVIKSKGRVLGTVRSARRTPWKHTQILEIDFLRFATRYGKYDIQEWKLPTARKDIQAGDIVCFLEDISRPMIIRPCNDHFDVIMITADLKVDLKNYTFHTWVKNWSLGFFTSLSSDFLLVWDLEDPQEKIGYSVREVRGTFLPSNSQQNVLNSEVGVYTDTKEHLRLGKYSEVRKDYEVEKDPEIRGYSEMMTEKLSEVIRLQNVAQILQNSELYGDAEKWFSRVVLARRHLQGRTHPQTLSNIADLQSAHEKQRALEESESRG